MDFRLTEDQTLIRDSAREFADEVLAPRAAELDRTGAFPIENFKEAAKRGFAGFIVPESLGGSDVGNLSMALAMIEINRGCASTGVTLSVHNSLVSAPLLQWGTEDQKQRWLPKLASGEQLGAYSLSEARSGSDAAALQCSAAKDGKHWVLDGTKMWVTSGSHADLFLVFARTNRKVSNAKGITAFIVRKGMPGFRVGKSEEKMGIRASSTTELIFEGCRVEEAEIVGQVDGGFKIAMSALDGGRIGIACQALGIAEACLRASIKYAKQRVQFGKPIAEYQPVQWKIAEMGVRIESARLLILHAAWLRDRGQPHSYESSSAKLSASRTANFCAREAVQIHGGAGY